MESVINNYVSRELIKNSEVLPLENTTSLIESGILDSLSVLELATFLEQQFGVVVAPEDLIPENFETIDAICRYLHTTLELQKSQV